MSLRVHLPLPRLGTVIGGRFDFHSLCNDLSTPDQTCNECMGMCCRDRTVKVKRQGWRTYPQDYTTYQQDDGLITIKIPDML